MQEKKILRATAESLSRVAEAKASVKQSMDTARVKANVRQLSKPSSPSSAMKKAGVALIVGTPDPVTAVPGVALLAASYAAKRREPAKLADLAMETRKILRDLQSLSL